jgi:hypothetical protein
MQAAAKVSETNSDEVELIKPNGNKNYPPKFHRRATKTRKHHHNRSR